MSIIITSMIIDILDVLTRENPKRGVVPNGGRLIWYLSRMLEERCKCVGSSAKLRSGATSHQKASFRAHSTNTIANSDRMAWTRASHLSCRSRDGDSRIGFEGSLWEWPLKVTMASAH